MAPRDLLAIVAICIVWALNTIVSKLALNAGLPPIFYAASRTLLVTLVLLPWLRPLPERLGRVLLVTLMVGGGGFALLFLGLRTASPSATAIVSLSGTPMTVLFAILILGERIRWRRGLGIALTLAGALLVLVDPAGLHATGGLLFVLAATALGALGAVLLKRLTTEPIRMQAWGGVSGTAVLLPLSLLLEHGQVDAALDAGWAYPGAVAFSALLVSVIAHTGYWRLLQRYDANLVAPLTLMTPLLTVALGAWITGDRIGPTLMAGALLSLAGVLVIVARPSRTINKGLLVRRP